MNQALFPSETAFKTLAEYQESILKCKGSPMTIVKVQRCMELDQLEWEEFAQHLLHNRDWLRGHGGQDDTHRHVVLVTGPQPEMQVFVDPAGGNYARFVGFPLEQEAPLEEPIHIELVSGLEEMTVKMLASSSYHPEGQRCAFCDRPRGRAGVCQHCEMACGDPCSRCDTGKGPDKHCPCCRPCGPPLEVSGTVTGRFRAGDPTLSNIPKPVLVQAERADTLSSASPLLDLLSDDASADDW